MDTRRIEGRESRGLLTAAVVIVALACHDATAPLSLSYSLHFMDDSTEQYGGDQCYGSGNLYCRTTVASSRTFDGTLRVAMDTATLDRGSEVWSAPGQNWKNDSLWITFVPPPSTVGCYYLGLKLVRASGDVTGTFIEQHDCHGRSSKGTVTGRVE